ncbi:sulfotransferase family protein [Chryseolinea lacunae]|uniref:Sulfotransferase family protein n=1 Tax=Chryseolinea lacunae TaxID=2801331 RepID=A0ABS1L0U2_9BACT|nr:sulfotransferase family protein [Chryseolinea lacunae]MBL0745142.1 sulfotransferase family protein [Chryseolinea lacunae]
MIRINLISGPRNISTALMYSFAQRRDTTVLDEPFYAFYLRQSGAQHPGKEDVMRAQPPDDQEVYRNVYGTWSTPVLFIKNMAHHLELMNEAQLADLTNVFLIRNPRQILASYAQVIEAPTLRDIGIEYQASLFKRLREQGHTPLVIDAGTVVEQPEVVLRMLCNRIGIPFMTAMLQWPAGPKPYDGVWASHWYANVHQSTGFSRQTTSDRPLPPYLDSLNSLAQRHYEVMLPFSLRP